MRHYLAMQQYGTGKGLPSNMLNRAGPGYSPYGNGMLAMNAETPTGKVVIQHFACRSLSIGTWRRVAQTTMDLVIFYSPDKACITYYINNDSAGYKIEYPFVWIKNISLEQGDVLSAAEGASQRAGGLVIELTRAPKFYMDSSGSGGFYECGDFTEDQQASQIMVHHLGGPSKVLSGQLAKLVSLEAYQNRHNFYDPSALAVSAPVSPIVHRPQSQPNHLFHPHSNISLLPPEGAPGMMGPPGPRGHKRQRSRSVPVAIDFSMLRHPMPSFLIQPEGQMAQPPMQDPSIFAPVPQHQHHPGFASSMPGASLSIDTSPNFSGFQFGGPVSATTANSPSEYGTPAFLAAGHHGDNMTHSQFNTPFNSGYLAVDPAAMIGTSNTPLSMYSHGDPVIADDSPPLNGVGRSQSADFFGTPGEHSQFGDEGLYLSESFHKQMSLPFRNPMSEDSFHSPMPDSAYNYNSPRTTGAEANGQHTPMNFQSPSHQSLHQDSGVAFSTPSHVSHDQSSMYPSPKDGSVVYHDSKMYTSPAQMHQMPHDQNVYQQSPLRNETGNEGLDMPNLGMYVNPNSLGNQK